MFVVAFRWLLSFKPTDGLTHWVTRILAFASSDEKQCGEGLLGRFVFDLFLRFLFFSLDNGSLVATNWTFPPFICGNLVETSLFFCEFRSISVILRGSWLEGLNSGRRRDSSTSSSKVFSAFVLVFCLMSIVDSPGLVCSEFKLMMYSCSLPSVECAPTLLSEA